MKPRQLRRLIPAILILMEFFVCLHCWAEHGFVLVQVQDAQHHPVRGVEIGIEGIGDSKLTDDHGKAQLAIGGASKQGDWLSLIILHSPPNTPPEGTGDDLAVGQPCAGAFI